jgi:hypothetical protein
MKLQELNDSELDLLVEGLQRLREVKVEAHATVVKKSPGHERFTRADFGVPQIDALMAKIESFQDQAWDIEAERITRDAGIGREHLNLAATSVLDL